ncbi:MAG TPA: GDP-mannose 4,6-dehydratase [Candidatus Cybelea sp.]|nr:GDP-mannose 4,6-dehydratase [Candidatus Cybelea sp.]
MRALVTGASGFVGGYLVDALRREGAEVLACGGPHDSGDGYFPIDLADGDSLAAALQAARPDAIFHLAAQSFVPDSLRSPLASLEVNVLGTARLVQAVRDYGASPGPRLLFTSSAEVYGPRQPQEYPLHERLDLRPANPYGASKAAAEATLLASAQSFGLDVVIARTFNTVGPRQSPRFVVSSLAQQLASIAGGAQPQMYVGNLASSRDFLDVRDVVEAYLTLARRGEGAQIYNVCSGRAVTIRDVLRELISIARVPVEVREDPQRLREGDVSLSVGSCEKLRAATGWQPRCSLTQSLRDIYHAARLQENE